MLLHKRVAKVNNIYNKFKRTHIMKKVYSIIISLTNFTHQFSNVEFLIKNSEFIHLIQNCVYIYTLLILLKTLSF